MTGNIQIKINIINNLTKFKRIYKFTEVNPLGESYDNKEGRREI